MWPARHFPAVLLLAFLLAAGAVECALPTIDTTACTALGACTGFPGVLPTACIKCLIGGGFVADWAALAAVPVMSRLPLAEAGFTAQFATPLLRPNRWLATSPPDPGVVALALGIYNNDNWGPALPKDVQVCNAKFADVGGCRTLDLGSTQGSFLCVDKPGWTFPGPVTAAFCNGAASSYYDVPFNTPEQMASLVPTTRGRDKFRAKSIAESKAFYSDPDAATDSLWVAANYAWQTTVFLRNVTGARIAAVANLYGSEFTPTMQQAAQNGEVVEIDLTSLQGFQPTSGLWSPAGHALLRVASNTKGRMDFEGLLIRLSNAPAAPAAAAVFSPQKSASAWVLACAIMRQAISQWSTWIGHVYHQHTTTAAVSFALYGTIEPGVPIGQATTFNRLMADFFLDPSYREQFASALFADGVTPPPTPILVQDLSKLFELYAVKGGPHGPKTDFWSLLPGQQLEATGLDGRVFQGKKREPFGAYPVVTFQRQMRASIDTFTAKVVGRYYATDADVAGDSQVQAWLAAMIDPLGGNLGKINPNNTLSSRAELARLWGDLIQLVLIHGVSHLQDYGARFGVPSSAPAALGSSVLPDPSKSYTTQELMDYAPWTVNSAGKYAFMTAFIGSQPFTQFVPSKGGPTGRPAWDAESPFGRGDAKSRAASSALVTFRKGLTNFLKGFPQDDIIRVLSTNWGQPTRLPRVIDM